MFLEIAEYSASTQKGKSFLPRIN